MYKIYCYFPFASMSKDQINRFKLSINHRKILAAKSVSLRTVKIVMHWPFPFRIFVGEYFSWPRIGLFPKKSKVILAVEKMIRNNYVCEISDFIFVYNFTHNHCLSIINLTHKMFRI